jgi:glycogen(starch) synthase
MRVLILSQQYSPVIGGIPTVTRLVATELAVRHEVRLLTATAGEPDSGSTFKLIRRPSTGSLLESVLWSEIVLLQGSTVRLGWPLLTGCRPYIVVHHIWLSSSKGDYCQAWLRRNLIRRGKNLCVSSAIGDKLNAPYEVISNPYNSDLFRPMPQIARNADLVFVGRLVHEKGAHHLLEALALIGVRGLRPSLTVIGDGPELERLKNQSNESGLVEQVVFAGSVTGEALAILLNRHRIVAIPSLWPEPFGIVALEGLACGCVAVGSSGGGLAGAIGLCGLTYPNGDTEALACAIELLLTDQVMVHNCLENVKAHLELFKPGVVATQYENIMNELVGI